MKLRHSARTDVGKTRDHNEDSYGVGEGEQAEHMGELLVVCDGMGGHAAGEVASQLGVETILSIYYGDASEDRPQVLEQAFEQANEQIYAHGRGSMGTTGVAALLHHDALHIANVGDSRAYLIRDGEIRQVSRDHSFVSDQVAAGLITADQARSSPHRNVITRALGYQSDVTVDLFRLPLQIGDIVVLCSDGLHGLVTDAEIAKIATSAPLDQAAQQLIDLANNRGGTDNITVIIAQVEALDWYSGEAVATDDLHERVTVELPATEPHTSESAAVSDAAPPMSSAPAGAATSAAHPAPVERRLTLLGGLLAMVLLAILVGIIYFAMSASPVLAPSQATPLAATTGASPAATSAATSGPSVAPTSGPTTPAPTGVPTAGPNSAPTTPAT